MNKNHKRTFINSAFIQYDYILGNEEIQRTVADFLLHYVSLEAYYKKLLRAEKEKSGERLTAKEIRNLKVDTREMKRVFRFLIYRSKKNFWTVFSEAMTVITWTAPSRSCATGWSTM